jgi:hypothetical protein
MRLILNKAKASEMQKLTPEQIEYLRENRLHEKAPWQIQNVSHGHFSVARYSGGCTYKDESYWYDHQSDTLTRRDVCKALERMAADERRKARAEKADKAKQAQCTLF